MVSELSDMLESTYPEYADVAAAKEHMGIEAATRLRDYVLAKLPSRGWYYRGESKARNEWLEDLLDSFEFKGYPLAKTYWDILYQYRLLRTPEERSCACSRRRRPSPPSPRPALQHLCPASSAHV
jgi:hypothetical protein